MQGESTWETPQVFVPYRANSPIESTSISQFSYLNCSSASVYVILCLELVFQPDSDSDSDESSQNLDSMTKPESLALSKQSSNTPQVKLLRFLITLVKRFQFSRLCLLSNQSAPKSRLLRVAPLPSS